jgi:hypothetical protein
LFNAASYHGTISNFVSGDTLDLAGAAAATEATLGAGNILTVAVGGKDILLKLNPVRITMERSFPSTPTGMEGQMLPSPGMVSIFREPTT